MQPGDKATWTRTLRGGYGYTERIPVRVVSAGRRVRVAVPLKNGGEKTVTVKPENLTSDVPHICPACGCTNAPGEGKCDDCGRDF